MASYSLVARRDTPVPSNLPLALYDILSFYILKGTIHFILVDNVHAYQQRKRNADGKAEDIDGRKKFVPE